MIDLHHEKPRLPEKAASFCAVSSTWSYSLTDHLGTAGVTDSFGNGSWGFTGREYDSYTELYYYRARMYDPKLGRFTSEDPIGFSGRDVNLYGYVANNAANLVDPLGTFGWCKQPDGSVRPCGPQDLARFLGNWNPWVSVDFQGSAHFLTIGGTTSTGIIYNPLTCEVCQTSKVCLNRGGGGFIGVGPQIGLQSGPYRGADKLNIIEEQSDITIEGGEGLGLGVSGSASTSGVALGINPQLATGAYVGSNLCAAAVTHCYFSP